MYVYDMGLVSISDDLVLSLLDSDSMPDSSGNTSANRPSNFSDCAPKFCCSQKLSGAAYIPVVVGEEAKIVAIARHIQPALTQ